MEVETIRTNVRTNDAIRAKQVRLISDEGERLGIVPVEDALEQARTRSLDLVEVAPDADPPVCRIMDYTKYVYDQKRKQKMAKKKSTKVDLKEIKLRPNIDKHDFSIKMKHAREFLEKGHKVKVTIRYRRREMRHYEIGTQVLEDSIQELNDLGALESESRGNRNMQMQTVIVAPRKSAEATANNKSKDEGDGAED